MRRVKTVPNIVLDWFKTNFPGMTYSFYVYKIDKTKPMSHENRVYGCEVFRDGRYYHNATQMTIDEFKRVA